ncbi:hypothetical protein EVAR_17160_1 [Eumeta japonica]|uniref:Uncharacterized protein n=1 Tax=Eumeta variegata TaxID=151549 RepID=A0A4C1UA93_EUMVA|nr:hypothetical protein EVAR_17160_1 [Eumeta japonica]
MVQNKILNIVDTTLFFALTLDVKLRWNSRILRLAKRLSSAAHAMKRMRRLNDETAARQVYFSSCQSLVTYRLFWDHEVDINIIFMVQKRAVCAIYVLRPMALL